MHDKKLISTWLVSIFFLRYLSHISLKLYHSNLIFIWKIFCLNQKWQMLDTLNWMIHSGNS